MMGNRLSNFKQTGGIDHMDFLNNFLEPLGIGLYNLLIALLILIGGYILARVIAAIVRGLLHRISLDNRLADALRMSSQRFSSGY
jgi:hypothetical protein